MSLWRPPLHNVPGIEHLWYESVHRSHAAVCSCGDPVRHLTALAERYGVPGGSRSSGAPGVGGNHNPPPIRRARHPAAAPDPPAGNQPPALPWHGDGGSGDGAAGGGDAGPVADFADDGLDEVVAALDEDERKLQYATETTKRTRAVDERERKRSRSPRRNAGGVDPRAAPAPAPRAASTPKRAPVPIRAASQNAAGSPRRPLPCVGPKQWLFPERKPKPPPSSGDWAMEYLMCKIMNRPPRTHLTDPPFYPYCKNNYNVTFQLNYK
ncbi:hypothetical protein TTV12_gp1 [Torque teno virus 12]|uniref:Hepatitis TT virus Orf2/Gyrovirus Vp2 N-terminal domain-containing protein n=1 Tax=Torque teno virus 12 TaxID=687351 RepID=Q8V7G2_9VIRU|nr:hypothetical protein TTV12_gp1 [Torque teno virus 12]BAB79347.1 unnamed protein product [Torque teno virus 12]